ncbi:LysR family transcriptional regulator [Nakamurella flava]|uniref:LysR family transcriptional regulator n=1 Tax=Nakamurella flava TaxID=2576308 RepID=A0A4U6QC57_9ACTN|nr:LysR family transcriptional regulator [Nakamurella flava]TKV57664.1 LysR family transcriptional regulator [Nakamurella flava]
MEIRQLQYLVAVADTGTFTAAAAREHVAQPAISAQIATLEREVGQRLFTRTARGAEPTEAGRELLTHARDILDRLTRAREAMSELAGVLRGRVTVGTMRGAPLGRLADVLGRFRRSHQGVDLTVREGESAALLDQLTAGAVDLALVGLWGRAPAGITTSTVLDSSVGAVVAATDPWAARRQVTLAQAADRPIVTLVPGTGVRTAFDAACRQQGLSPRVGFEVGTVGAAIELARAGLGVAVVPADPSLTVGPDGRALAIVRPVVRSRLALAWAADTVTRGRPAARALLAAVRPDRTA